MQNNSIIKCLTKSSAISALTLKIGADFRREKTFVVVEGQDDIALLKKLLNNVKVSIIESHSGKKGVHEIVEAINNKGVIGICDKDYEAESTDEKFICYDFCCLEMMLIFRDSCFDSIYSEYYKGEIDSNQFRLNILKNLEFISLMREKNSLDSLGINFEGLSIANIINSECLSIKPYNDHLVEIKKVNKEEKKDLINEIAAVLLEPQSTKSLVNYLNITNGHDFIKLFTLLCARNQNKKCDEVAAGLRCAYSIEDFKSSALYNKLIEYQRNNNLIIV